MSQRKSRKYTPEFQQNAIQLALQSPSISVAARELGIPGPTLSNWVYRFKDGTIGSAKTAVLPKGENLDPATVKQLKDNLAALLEETKRLNKKISVLEEERLY